MSNLIKNAWINFVICFFFGGLGIHKFREKRILWGILYLLTGGLLSFGWLYDNIKYLIIAIGATIGNESASLLAKKIALWITVGWLILLFAIVVIDSSNDGTSEVNAPDDSVLGSEDAEHEIHADKIEEPLGDQPENDKEEIKENDESLQEEQIPVVDAHEHSWLAATCTTPKTCSTCGAAEGSAAEHSWNNATCQKPKTCSTCGVTEGGNSAHSWENAGCTTPKTCSVCGTNDGSANGHVWNSASCTAAKKCSTCGQTEGNALGHNYSSGKCIACGAVDSSYHSNSNSNDNSGSGVYRTPSGKRYHFDPDCGGKNSTPISLDKAKNEGLTPCEKCAQ